MFVDIVGASEVSNHKGPRDYATFVRSFQELFEHVCQRHHRAWYAGAKGTMLWRSRGDEGLLMILSAVRDLSRDIDVAIQIALEFKRSWLLASENTSRIRSGLLPLDVGVGIHVGKAFLPKPRSQELEPEGYVINLAKRVESHSREGKFSRIFLSEATHGQLRMLSDEFTYLFDAPEHIAPKGFTGGLRVYEVKHHFLPTDWKDPSTRSRCLLETPSKTQLETMELAYNLNPTNIWLIEERIRSHMLWDHTRPANGVDPPYGRAADLAKMLARSELCDAGVLLILGFIEGERGEYAKERDSYKQALVSNANLAEAYWYTALSHSFELFDDFRARRRRFDSLHEDVRVKVGETIAAFEEAIARRPNCGWIHFDLGCEKIRWRRSEQEVVSGLTSLQAAGNTLDPGDLAAAVRNEPYLQSVKDNPIVEKLAARRPTTPV